jgi:hypothetical protein
LIEADPHADEDGRGEADEPGVAVVVGGAGLARDGTADAQFSRRVPRASDGTSGRPTSPASPAVRNTTLPPI